MPSPSQAFGNLCNAYAKAANKNYDRTGIADSRDWPHSSYDAILHDKLTRVSKTAVLEWFRNEAAFAEAHQTEIDSTPITHLIEET